MTMTSISKTRRLHQLLACACVLALATQGCGRGEDREQSRKSTVTVLYKGDERVLSPYQDMPAKFMMFLPLVTRDEKGELVGQLASAWEHSPDYRRWTFHLRTDVSWHDGVPFTAQDIAFSVELLAHPDVLQASAFIVNLESITVTDDFTFTITYTTPKDALDEWAVYYPKHLLEDLDPKAFWEWEFWTRPVGNGPYRYVRHVPKTMIELEANPDYYRGKPRIEHVVLKFGGSTPLVELLSGNVDMIANANRGHIPKLEEDPRFRVYPGIEPSWSDAILWNQRYPLFSDPRVRRALTLAIDRGELRQILNLPDDLVTADVIFTERQYRRGELPESLPYDPERSRRLLEQAGWLETGADGAREREGEEFRFTAIVRQGTTTASHSLVQPAIYIQSQLRRVGVRMDVQVLDGSLMRKRIRSGEFEAAFYRITNAEHIRAFGRDSWIGYDNPRVAALLDAAKETADPGKKDDIYRELFSIFLAELPVTFLFPRVFTTIAHRRIQGLSSLWRVDPAWYMDRLWLEDDSGAPE